MVSVTRGGMWNSTDATTYSILSSVWEGDVRIPLSQVREY